MSINVEKEIGTGKGKQALEVKAGGKCRDVGDKRKQEVSDNSGVDPILLHSLHSLSFLLCLFMTCDTLWLNSRPTVC